MNYINWQNRLAAVLKRITRFERVVTFIAFLVLIGVVFSDVASREIGGTGLHWARQVGVYANLLVILFGIGLASASGTHLRPRFADHWLPARWSGTLDRIQEGVMALFCAGFAVVAIDVVADGYDLGERSAILGTLIWPLQAVLPLVFTLAAFRHGSYALYPALRPISVDAEAMQSDNDGSGQGC